jgi:hypothetical protein
MCGNYLRRSIRTTIAPVLMDWQALFLAGGGKLLVLVLALSEKSASIWGCNPVMLIGRPVARGKKQGVQVDPPQPDEKLPPDASAAKPALAPEQPPTEEENAGGTMPGGAADEEIEAQADGETETADAEQKLPRCPNCGWRNVRKSHSNGPIDTLMKMFSVLPFRCRSCGLRFHRRWITKKADADE